MLLDPPVLLRNLLVGVVGEIPEHVVAHDQNPAVVPPIVHFEAALVNLLAGDQIEDLDVVIRGQPLLELRHPVQNGAQRTDDQNPRNVRFVLVLQQRVAQSDDLNY